MIPPFEPTPDLDGTVSAWLAAEGKEPVAIRGSCGIGRSASNQLSLPSEKVSRRHALVHSQEQNQFWLVDLGSSNGTFLNGRRVTQPMQLQDQDQIEICQIRIVFHQPRRTIQDSSLTALGTQTVHEVKFAKCWLLLADLAGSTQLLKEWSADKLAAQTGRWLAECKQIIEESGGSINKFLGDGFFAYWHDRERVSVGVARALESLKRLQRQGELDFRVVVHFGEVCSGGGASMGEESLSGPEVNFIFRAEKVAGHLGFRCMASKPAADLLMAFLPMNDAGAHPVASFDGEFPFYAF